MSEENGETTWRLGDAWTEGGIEAVLEETVGHDAVIEGLIAVGDSIVVRVRAHRVGEQPGLEDEMEFSQVLTFRKGKLVLAEYFWDHREALEAAGLSTRG
jgi:ketosteroid isomerase-like protein